MTTEERLSRIENALIAGGLMAPNPTPSIEEILKDLKAGHKASLAEYLKRNKGRTDVWPFVPQGKRGRRKTHELPSA